MERFTGRLWGVLMPAGLLAAVSCLGPIQAAARAERAVAPGPGCPASECSAERDEEGEEAKGGLPPVLLWAGAAETWRIPGQVICSPPQVDAIACAGRIDSVARQAGVEAEASAVLSPVVRAGMLPRPHAPPFQT